MNIELNEDEIELLLECIEEFRFSYDTSKQLRKIEEKLEKLKERHNESV